jgi:dTDP-4-dehydrorhamnose 3,5-epimerase
MPYAQVGFFNKTNNYQDKGIANMPWIELKLKGAFIYELEPFMDNRGFFARTFSTEDLKETGLNPKVAQCNLAYNYKKGTLRGMHFQIEPATEVKLVRTTRGAIYDVIIDLRPESPTYLQHVGVELSAENRRTLYVPEMFAHGYQTLTDDAEVFYQVSHDYAPQYARGYRYNDPAFNIEWPLPVTEISEKDQNWASFEVPCL